MSSLTLPPATLRYGVWTNPNSETVAYDAR